MRFAVVPTHNRPDDLRAMLASLGLPAHRVLVVDNASSPPLTQVDAVVVRDDEQPPHLSRMWNIGLDWAAEQAGGEPYAVAVLNDDLVLPPGFLDAMVAAMDRTGAVAAFPDQHGRGHDLVNREPGLIPRAHRMTGFAFVLNGKAGLRVSEEFRWWYGDDDLEWQARAAGGTVLVGGVKVEHLHPDVSTRASPALREQAERDRAAFIEKWGRDPWPDSWR